LVLVQYNSILIKLTVLEYTNKNRFGLPKLFLKSNNTNTVNTVASSGLVDEQDLCQLKIQKVSEGMERPRQVKRKELPVAEPENTDETLEMTVSRS